MKTNKKLYSVALASAALILFSILISFTASAVSPPITEAPIITSGSAQFPSIYGDRIVWQKGSGADFTNLGVYDLSTNREIQITTNSLTVPREPKIYGDRIVWIDANNGSYDEYGYYDTFDIYMYNLSTSEKTQITTSGSASWPTAPAIYGNIIVWDEYRNNGDNVYMYDLSTRKETQITNNGVSERPAVYKDKIVWEQVNDSTRGGDICSQRNDVYVYNISTSNTTRIITGKANYYRVAISGDKIVWQSWINGGSDIYVYDLSTGKNTQLTNSGSAYNPAIYADRIVWHDGRNGNADIYLYNLSTSEETQVTIDDSDQRCPAIYGDTIVWEDGSYISVGTISKENVVNFSSNVTRGYPPLSVQFTDLSQNATGWDWEFGDGATSFEQNPMHTYSEAGTYTVKLIVTNENGKYSTFDTINVLTTNPCAYVTSYYDNAVYVIETVTNNVIARVNVGIEPWGVAVTPDGTKVYVTNVIGDTVSVIDTATNTVTSTVSVGRNPQAVAVTPDGKRAYVTSGNDNTVSVIDTASNTVTYTVPAGNSPYGVAITPDGTKVYVTNNDNSCVSVIDTTNNTVTGTVNVGQWPVGVAVTPDGTKVYVINSGDNNVSVIDTATNNIINTVNVGQWPVGVTVTPDGTKVYVVNSDDNTVSVIDTATNNIINTVNVGSGPFGIAVTPDGTKVYVANWNDNNVSVIDTATNDVTGTVNVGGSPVAFGQFIGEKTVLEPVLPVSNPSSNVTSGANVEQEPEQTQSSETSGKGSTKTPDFEIASGIICLLGAFLYKQDKKR